MVDTVFFKILPVLLGIIVLLLLVVIVVKYVLATKKWGKRASLPVESCKAAVLEKQAAERCRRSLSVSSFETESVVEYRVVFLLEDGRQNAFSVDESVFDLLAEGDTGTLVFQAERFLKFERS